MRDKKKKDHNRIHIMESMPVRRAILKLSIPTMVAMLIQVVYNMTDTFFIGKLNNPNMVAAIAICMPVVMAIQTFGSIFAFGGASVISRLLGEGKQDDASNAASISFWASLGLCLATSLALMVLSDPVLVACGASPDTLPYASAYLQIMLIGGVFMGMQMTVSGLLRAEGATKESMIGMVTGSLINMILDPLFILVMDMGVAGAALATLIGNAVGFSYFVAFYLRKRGCVSVSWRRFSFKWKYYASIFKIGIPASLETLLITVVMALLNVIAAGYGDIVVASFAIVFRLTNISFMLVIGMAQGCQPLMGYNYGAKQRDRLLDTIKYAIMYATGICILFTAVFYLFAEAWISLFIVDPDVVAMGVTIMHARVISMPFIGVLMIFRTTFQALGRSKEAFILSIGRQGLFFIPSLIAFNALWGLSGFIYAMPFTNLLTTGVATAMFVALRRKLLYQ